MKPADLIRDFFVHHRWAARKVMAQLEQCELVDLERQKFEGAASPMQTLRHMVQSEAYWTALFVRGDGAMEAARVFEPITTVAEMRSAWDGLYIELNPYLARLDNDELDRVFDVTFPGGKSFSPNVSQVVSQLTVHSSQHRAELALIASGLGHSPGELDLWDFLSETGPSAIGE